MAVAPRSTRPSRCNKPMPVRTIETAASHAGDELDTDMMMSDLQASNEFRAQLLEVYTERALTAAMNRTDGSAAAD